MFIFVVQSYGKNKNIQLFDCKRLCSQTRTIVVIIIIFYIQMRLNVFLCGSSSVCVCTRYKAVVNIRKATNISNEKEKIYISTALQNVYNYTCKTKHVCRVVLCVCECVFTFIYEYANVLLLLLLVVFFSSLLRLHFYLRIFLKFMLKRLFENKQLNLNHRQTKRSCWVSFVVVVVVVVLCHLRHRGRKSDLKGEIKY